MADQGDIFDRIYYCRDDCPDPGIYSGTPLDYGILLDLMGAYASLLPPEPVKLTQEQWDQVKALIGTPAPGAIPPLAPLYGVPVHIVDCVQDSTPYQRWLRNHVHFAPEPLRGIDG